MNKNEVIEKVEKEILEAEKSGDYQMIDTVLCKKRLAWLDSHLDVIEEKNPVKKAYLLLFKKLEIDFSEVPIVYKDKRKIIWHSYNFCPVLEACKELNLDTRRVCKEGYENSVQKFVQEINPHLKFSRNYKTLRPYGEYCEEMIRLIK